jgi:hypothetical protein
MFLFITIKFDEIAFRLNLEKLKIDYFIEVKLLGEIILTHRDIAFALLKKGVSLILNAHSQLCVRNIFLFYTLFEYKNL